MLFSSLFLALAATTLSKADSHPHRDTRHFKRASSSSLIQVSSTSFLCNVLSDLPVTRDLGFVGRIQNTMIYTYGDTLSNTSSFYMTSDSSAIGTSNPCYVLNTQRTSDKQHPTDMVAPNATWGEVNTADAFGGTNVIPFGGIHSNQGVMFFLKNHRPLGQADYIRGAVSRPTSSHLYLLTAKTHSNLGPCHRNPLVHQQCNDIPSLRIRLGCRSWRAPVRRHRRILGRDLHLRLRPRQQQRHADVHVPYTIPHLHLAKCHRVGVLQRLYQQLVS